MAFVKTKKANEIEITDEINNKTYIVYEPNKNMYAYASRDNNQEIINSAREKAGKKEMHPLEWAINIDLVFKEKNKKWNKRIYVYNISGRHPAIIGIQPKKEPKKTKKKNSKKNKKTVKKESSSLSSLSSLSLIEESSSDKKKEDSEGSYEEFEIEMPDGSISIAKLYNKPLGFSDSDSSIKESSSSKKMKETKKQKKRRKSTERKQKQLHKIMYKAGEIETPPSSDYSTESSSGLSEDPLIPDEKSKPFEGLEVADWQEYLWDNRFDNWNEEDPKCWNKKKYMRPCMHDDVCKCGFNSEKGPSFWKNSKNEIQVWKDEHNKLYMKKELFDKIKQNTIDEEIARVLEIKSIS